MSTTNIFRAHENRGVGGSINVKSQCWTVLVPFNPNTAGLESNTNVTWRNVSQSSIWQQLSQRAIGRGTRVVTYKLGTNSLTGGAVPTKNMAAGLHKEPSTKPSSKSKGILVSSKDVYVESCPLPPASHRWLGRLPTSCQWIFYSSGQWASHWAPAKKGK